MKYQNNNIEYGLCDSKATQNKKYFRGWGSHSIVHGKSDEDKSITTLCIFKLQ